MLNKLLLSFLLLWNCWWILRHVIKSRSTAEVRLLSWHHYLLWWVHLLGWVHLLMLELLLGYLILLETCHHFKLLH